MTNMGPALTHYFCWRALSSVDRMRWPFQSGLSSATPSHKFASLNSHAARNPSSLSVLLRFSSWSFSAGIILFSVSHLGWIFMLEMGDPHTPRHLPLSPGIARSSGKCSPSASRRSFVKLQKQKKTKRTNEKPKPSHPPSPTILSQCTKDRQG